MSRLLGAPYEELDVRGMREGGFPPETWGPSFWKSIHFAAAAYPLRPSAAERAAMMDFLKSLRYVLPCPGCRAGYAQIIARAGPTRLTPGVVADRAALFAWTCAVHDAVSDKLGKPRRRTAAAWYQAYDRLRAG